MLPWNEYLRIFIGLIAIVGPVSGAPLFLSFTENIKSQRPRVARISALAVAIILCLSVIAGVSILEVFSISVDSFRIAGGMLLITIAFEMLQARTGDFKHTEEEDREAIDSDSVGVVPLALPLLAGPGAISTVILFSGQSDDIMHKLVLSALCCLIALIIWISFRLAPSITRKLSQTTMNIFSRVMGLILAAMAVEFIVGGLRSLLPGLA